MLTSDFQFRDQYPSGKDFPIFSEWCVVLSAKSNRTSLQPADWPRMLGLGPAQIVAILIIDTESSHHSWTGWLFENGNSNPSQQGLKPNMIHHEQQ